jgi:hypothetical protein
MIKPCTCGSLSIAVTYLYMFVPSELSSFSSSSCLMADHQTAAVVATLPTWPSRHIHGRYRGAIPRALATDRDYPAGSDDKIPGYTCVPSEYRNRPRPRMFEPGVCACSSTHAIVNLTAELVSAPTFSLPSKGQGYSEQPTTARSPYPANSYQTCMNSPQHRR